MKFCVILSCSKAVAQLKPEDKSAAVTDFRTDLV